MRKSARTPQRDGLEVAQGAAVGGAGDLGVYPVLEARVLAGVGVEVHNHLTFLERVLAEYPDPAILYLYDVVAGTGVAPEPCRRGSPGVHDKHVLQPPRVRHVLVPGEDQVHAQLYQEFQDVPRVEDDVPLAARAGYRDQVMVHHEDLELIPRVFEAVPDKAVVLAAHPPVVEIRLRGVHPDHDRLLELDDRVTLPEEPLEVYVPDVPRVVVARYHHQVLAPET